MEISLKERRHSAKTLALFMEDVAQVASSGCNFGSKRDHVKSYMPSMQKWR